MVDSMFAFTVISVILDYLYLLQLGLFLRSWDYRIFNNNIKKMPSPRVTPRVEPLSLKYNMLCSSLLFETNV